MSYMYPTNSQYFPSLFLIIFDCSMFYSIGKLVKKVYASSIRRSRTPSISSKTIDLEVYMENISIINEANSEIQIKFKIR